MIKSERLAELRDHLKQIRGLWCEAMQSGDASDIEPTVEEGITCYFGSKGLDQLAVIGREGIIAGMQESVAALQGCTKRFENELIRMRSDEEAVVFFEQVVEREGKVLARLFTLETYRYDSGRWVCVREVVEHAGA